MNDKPALNEKAQGMVEFAFVLPLLLLIVLGIIEFGRMLFIYSSVSASSREAARYGASTEDVGGSTYRYRDCAGIISAAQRVGILAGIDSGDISIYYDDGSAVVEPSCNPSVSVDRGDRIVVSVTANYEPVVPLVNIPAIPITSMTARTIIKDVAISGSPPDDPEPPPPPPPPPPDPQGCPTSPTGLDNQGAKKLKLDLSNPPPYDEVTIEDIELFWTASSSFLKSVAFLSLSWNGSAPPTFTLSNYSSTPVSVGSFEQQDMIFTFSENLSGFYQVTVTFEGDDCDPVTATYND
jgi:Flp pilus assembly protein TadG